MILSSNSVWQFDTTISLQYILLFSLTFMHTTGQSGNGAGDIDTGGGADQTSWQGKGGAKHEPNFATTQVSISDAHPHSHIIYSHTHIRTRTHTCIYSPTLLNPPIHWPTRTTHPLPHTYTHTCPSSHSLMLLSLTACSFSFSTIAIVIQLPCFITPPSIFLQSSSILIPVVHLSIEDIQVHCMEALQVSHHLWCHSGAHCNPGGCLYLQCSCEWPPSSPPYA